MYFWLSSYRLFSPLKLIFIARLFCFFFKATLIIFAASASREFKYITLQLGLSEMCKAAEEWMFYSMKLWCKIKSDLTLKGYSKTYGFSIALETRYVDQTYHRFQKKFLLIKERRRPWGLLMESGPYTRGDYNPLLLYLQIDFRCTGS